MKPGILCVLKDPADLQPLARLQHLWDIASTSEASQALEILSQRQFEAVLADWRIPGKDGMSFLTLAMNRHPKIIRLLLFDPAEKSEKIKGDPAAHQWLAKPCSAESLKAAIEHARELGGWLMEPAIKQLIPRIKKIPSVPTVYFRLMKVLQDSESGLEDIGRILAEDLALTARVLQIVNSAAFGLDRSVTSPSEAVSYLGIEKTKTLVLVAQAFSGMEGAKSSPFSIERLWRHSMSTGKLAQWIARDETGDARMADETFTAGVLHDVGKLMLAANLPEEYNAIYKRAQEKQISLEVAEREAFGTTHAEIGACLLGAWGLPFSVVEAIAFHHNPAQHPMKDFGPVTAVHVANVLDHEMQPDPEEKLPRKIDADYLARLNRENLPAHWRQVCLAEQ